MSLRAPYDRIRRRLQVGKIARSMGRHRCILRGDRRGAVFFGLCRGHYAEALSGRLPSPPRPAKGQCGVEGHAVPPVEATPFCREHLELFRRMKNGRLLLEARRRSPFPMRRIPVRSIRIGVFAMRPDITDSDVIDLAASIAEEGQLVPVLVVPHPRGGYRLVYGHRRLRACQVLGLPTLLAQIAPAGTPTPKLAAYASAENFERQWIPPFAKTAWVAKLRQVHGLSPARIADVLNETERSVRAHLQIASRTHPKVLDAYLSGRLSMNAAIALSRLDGERQRQELTRLAALPIPEQRRAARRMETESFRTDFERWLRSPGPGTRITRGRHGYRLEQDRLTKPLLRALYRDFYRPRLRRPGGRI